MDSFLLKRDNNGFYVDLHVSDVSIINHRSTSLDADARLIPPRMDMPCFSNLERVDMLLVLALDYHDHNVISESTVTRIQHDPPLVFFDGDNKGDTQLFGVCLIRERIPRQSCCFRLS